MSIMTRCDWTEVYNAVGPNDKAEAYQKIMDKAMNDCFPERTVRKRKLEPPWFNNTLRKLTRAKTKLFKRVGRSDEWKD